MLVNGIALLLFLLPDKIMWLYFIINMWLYLGCLALMTFIFICQQLQLCCLSCRLGRRNVNNPAIQSPLMNLGANQDNQV